MCMHIRKERFYKRTAKEDIVCYKSVKKSDDENIVLSVYYFFKYRIGRTYRKRKIVKPRPLFKTEGFKIDGGFFHSYISLRNAKIDIRPGSGRIVVKCMIPKGSKYYRGDDLARNLCYCSNAIRVVKVLNEKVSNSFNDIL